MLMPLTGLRCVFVSFKVVQVLYTNHRLRLISKINLQQRQFLTFDKSTEAQIKNKYFIVGFSDVEEQSLRLSWSSSGAIGLVGQADDLAVIVRGKFDSIVSEKLQVALDMMSEKALSINAKKSIATSLYQEDMTILISLRSLYLRLMREEDL